MATYYGERMINRAPGGFGMFQLGERPACWWSDLGDMRAEWEPAAMLDAFELTDTAVAAGLPDGIEDIRGRIQGGGGRVYGQVDLAGYAWYWMIEEREGPDDAIDDDGRWIAEAATTKETGR